MMEDINNILRDLSLFETNARQNRPSSGITKSGKPCRPPPPPPVQSSTSVGFKKAAIPLPNQMPNNHSTSSNYRNFNRKFEFSNILNR